MQNTETSRYKQETTEKCRGVAITMEGLSHLPEKQIDKLIKEEPEITVKGYLLFLSEINDIKKSTKNGTEENDY